MKAKSKKGGYVLFATITPDDSEHNVYLSAYGYLASDLLEKYMDDNRADYEDIFTEWDKSVEEAISKPGFTASHEVDDGYIYITTYQNGIGIQEDN
jgi:hypothetical protein